MNKKQRRENKMKYMVDFGEYTDPEYYDSIEGVEAMLDEYLKMHVDEDEIEEAKISFLKNNVSEVENE